MNLLRITTRIYPDTGGPAKIVLTCKPKSTPYQSIKIINKYFIIHYLPFSAPGINSSLLTQMIFFTKFLGFGLIRAIKIIYKHKISIIHGHSPPPTGLLIYLLSKMLKIPYIYSIHGLDYPNALSLSLEMNLTVKNSEKTIVVNRNIKKFIMNKFKIKNISWFPNSIDLNNFFHINSEEEKKKIIQNLKLEHILKIDDFIISYIGYMIFSQKVKGMIDFLRAFHKFYSKIGNKDQQKIKLLYIGDGKFSFLLKNEIKQLNLEKTVYLLGNRNDVNNILAISDLLGLTSYIEGFPNVVLEAMASKVPCLVSNVGEIQYMVGESGFIVKPGEINKIEAYLEDYYNLIDKKRNLLMESVHTYAKNNFDVNIIGNRLIQLYFDIINTNDP
jgi:glycosyltransferase involved in cell wall biosynthesis